VSTARTGGGLFTRPGTPVGTWLKITSGEPVEIMAYAGFDFVVVDLEHAPLDLQTAYRLVNAAAALGMTPLVRVPDGTPSTIQKVLDAGAMGILVPHVDTVEQARAVGRACRFPPHGVRGAGGTSRAGAWGLRPTAEYLATGNDDVLCVPQLESVEAVKAAPEILALHPVDAVFVGAADLALSMGTTPAGPEVAELVAAAVEAAHAAGKRCGLAFGAEPARAARAECDFALLSNDTSMLAAAARDLVTGFRDAAGEES
jgi:2-dehydro-3-deoxyglucarate aldolase/4-hydroxy-2-oxoheptanedioate aldolase